LEIPLDTQTRVLDFGCGWGRHYRFFLRELKPGNFVGIDIDAGCIETCRRTIPMGNFEQCEIQPPVRFDSASFDVVYAYSVFSHLSEKAHLRWIEEFGRILRPGGMLVVSTMLREHLGVWLEQSTDESKPWCIANLKRVNFDIDRFQAGFDSGQFLYCPTGGGGIRSDDFYGEAIISPAYARENWAAQFRIVDYLSYPQSHPQALIVCQRK
jgi:SAM-dependent methyltransferase